MSIGAFGWTYQKTMDWLMSGDFEIDDVALNMGVGVMNALGVNKYDLTRAQRWGWPGVA